MRDNLNASFLFLKEIFMLFFWSLQGLLHSLQVLFHQGAVSPFFTVVVWVVVRVVIVILILAIRHHFLAWIYLRHFRSYLVWWIIFFFLLNRRVSEHQVSWHLVVNGLIFVIQVLVSLRSPRWVRFQVVVIQILIWRILILVRCVNPLFQFLVLLEFIGVISVHLRPLPKRFVFGFQVTSTWLPRETTTFGFNVLHIIFIWVIITLNLLNLLDWLWWGWLNLFLRSLFIQFLSLFFLWFFLHS